MVANFVKKIRVNYCQQHYSLVGLEWISVNQYGSLNCIILVGFVALMNIGPYRSSRELLFHYVIWKFIRKIRYNFRVSRSEVVQEYYCS